MSVTREVSRRLKQETPRSVAQRLVRRAYDRLGAGGLDFPLLPGQVVSSSELRLAAATPRHRTGPLTIGWLCTPPSRGSGGHTTMFRMIAALERAGHRCVVLLHDRHGGDVARHAALIRDGWPWVAADVRSITEGLRGLDACVATGWPTAHVLGTVPGDVHRFYFIQDFEPFFFARGSEYELAADTYRFGFTNIALGRMVRDRLESELGVSSELVPFSCDTSVYGHENTGSRSGVVFYTKPDVARRGYRLGALALEQFHRRHPEQEIHVYGEIASDLAVPVTRHDRLLPEDLNTLYNSSIAGLAMSFTNISLVAEEMLAAGCTPVVNASVDARADLDNPHVAWAEPTVAGIATALSTAVESWTVETSTSAAASVRTDDWRLTGDRVVRIIEDVARAGAPRPAAIHSGS